MSYYPQAPPRPLEGLTADELHRRGCGLLTTLEWQLSQLEAGDASAVEAGATPSSLTETLNQLLQDVSSLERVLEEGGEGGHREIMKRRAAQLGADAAAQRRAVERFLKVTYAAREEQRERGLLFGGAAQRAEGVAVDSALRERSSLLASHTMMDEVAAAAEGVMGALQSQRATIKGAHKRVLDIAASLGVSNSLMKIIERRSLGDKVLVYGGSAFITLLCLAVWWFR